MYNTFVARIAISHLVNSINGSGINSGVGFAKPVFASYSGLYSSVLCVLRQPVHVVSSMFVFVVCV